MLSSIYESIGLNEYFQPINAPVSSQGAVDPYTFDYSNDRNAVSASHIRYLNADQIQSGTIVVSLNLGTAASGSVILDGANNRIVVHDGTTNRIVIGNV